MMTIYLDVVLLENLCMNYIILFATNYILKMKAHHVRFMLSALLGAIYAIVSYMNILPIYSYWITKIIVSVIMVYIAYYPKNGKQLLKQTMLFYLISFVFGGCAFALLYIVKPQEIWFQNGVFIGTYPIKITILGAILGFTISSITFSLIKKRLTKKDMFCKISIFIEGKESNLKAMIDTGNILKEPITQIPVIIVEKRALSHILSPKILEHIDEILGGDADNIEPKYATRLRIIPFSSVGKENGILLGIKPDKVVVTTDETEETIRQVIIGIYTKELSKRREYSALLGLDIFERSKDEHEFSETIGR